MNIVILADSRGNIPQGLTWIDAFDQKTKKAHKISSYISGRDSWLISFNMKRLKRLVTAG